MMVESAGVYIMGNANLTLYTGFSGNIAARVLEHQQKLVPGFTKKYKLTLCLYYEDSEDTWQARIREKQIKNMGRAEKIELIKSKNLLFIDLSSALM
jgi:putative endonuclease